MRQLNISKRPFTTPAEQAAYEAEAAQSLPLLRSLSALRPLGCAAEDEERLHRYIVSVATQYYGQGKSMAQLLIAGHNALADSYDQYNGSPEYFARFGTWCVRQGMLAALERPAE